MFQHSEYTQIERRSFEVRRFKRFGSARSNFDHSKFDVSTFGVAARRTLIIRTSRLQMATERRSFEVSVIGPAVVRRCERVKSEGDKGLSMFRFSLIYQNGHTQPDTLVPIVS